jgi:TRAP transporter 4TM/12TM fusion protein
MIRPMVSSVSDAEAAPRVLRGTTARVAAVLAAALSIYALYWVVAIVPAQFYRVSFLLITLILTFLCYPAVPAARRDRGGAGAVDWALAGLTVAALGWPLISLEQFVYRAATPSTADIALGTLTVALVLEATRRTIGWILPVTAIAFLGYAYFGAELDRIGLELFAHRGYGADRLIGSLYIGLDGIFGVPLDVAATYIVLFTIYGAVLEQSGAGKFFIEWSLAAMGGSSTAAGPGRTVTVAGFLLGTVSGSGVATTVTLGAMGWPLLRRAGYTAESGGAILSAAGIGAILSPPTLGAAAFLIAEFLRISYLQVLVMASIPTLLYYLSIFFMIEGDSRRMTVHAVAVDTPGAWTLTSRYGYHFLSLVAIAAFMIAGMSAFRAVFWATLLAAGLSYLRRETALGPRGLLSALERGGKGVVAVAATTATAGIIVGIVTLTGLGLKIAGIIVGLAGASVFLTVVYSAIAVWVLGLAVPVTASYILAAVMIAPALVQVGVPAVAAHMFIFYYAVLSEVSPPTALSPFAAAAITGGNPFKTMMLTWKYTLPAFLVPFVFTLSSEGMGLLLQAGMRDVLWGAGTAALGVVALAGGLSGWIWRGASAAERVAVSAGGLCLFAANRKLDAVGVALVSAVVLWQQWRSRRNR